MAHTKNYPAIFNWKDLCPEFEFLADGGHVIEDYENSTFAFFRHSLLWRGLYTPSGNHLTLACVDPTLKTMSWNKWFPELQSMTAELTPDTDAGIETDIVNPNVYTFEVSFYWADNEVE